MDSRLVHRLLAGRINGLSHGHHHPDRTTWLCIACPNPWPCSSSQKELIAAFTRRDGTVDWLALFGWLGIEFSAAVEVLPPDAHGQWVYLWRRFFRWAKVALDEMGAS